MIEFLKKWEHQVIFAVAAATLAGGALWYASERDKPRHQETAQVQSQYMMQRGPTPAYNPQEAVREMRADLNYDGVEDILVISDSPEGSYVDLSNGNSYKRIYIGNDHVIAPRVKEVNGYRELWIDALHGQDRNSPMFLKILSFEGDHVKFANSFVFPPYSVAAVTENSIIFDDGKFYIFYVRGERGYEQRYTVFKTEASEYQKQINDIASSGSPDDLKLQNIDQILGQLPPDYQKLILVNTRMPDAQALLTSKETLAAYGAGDAIKWYAKISEERKYEQMRESSTTLPSRGFNDPTSPGSQYRTENPNYAGSTVDTSGDVRRTDIRDPYSGTRNVTTTFTTNPADAQQLRQQQWEQQRNRDPGYQVYKGFERAGQAADQGARRINDATGQVMRQVPQILPPPQQKKK